MQTYCCTVWMALSENVHQWGRPGDVNLTLLSQPFVLVQVNFQLLCEVEVTLHSFFLSHAGSTHGRCALLSLVRAPPAHFLVAPLPFYAVSYRPRRGDSSLAKEQNLWLCSAKLLCMTAKIFCPVCLMVCTFMLHMLLLSCYSLFSVSWKLASHKI